MRRQFECPNQQQEVFKLPEVIQSKANEQYERDVARMAGERPVAVQLPYSSARPVYAVWPATSAVVQLKPAIAQSAASAHLARACLC